MHSANQKCHKPQHISNSLFWGFQPTILLELIDNLSAPPLLKKQVTAGCCEIHRLIVQS
jgi:hypothetical protein